MPPTWASSGSNERQGRRRSRSTASSCRRATLDAIRSSRVAIKGPITTPVGDRLPKRQRGVATRARPVRRSAARAGAARRPDPPPQRRPGRDPREHRGPLRGIEYQARLPRSARAVGKSCRRSGRPRAAPGCRHHREADQRQRHASGSSGSRSSTRRANGRKKVTVGHKANVMRYSDGLFLQTAEQEIAGLHRRRVAGDPDRSPQQPPRPGTGHVRRVAAAEPVRRHPERPVCRAWSGGWG